jgi:CheY-specific phosphatase CheX
MQDLELELHNVMEEVLTSLLGEEFDPSPPRAAIDRSPPHAPSDGSPPQAASGPRLTCAVRIHGGWNGQVVVQASLGLADLAARRMFGKEHRAQDSRQDAQDALREIANIVAGNLMPLFGEFNNLGLPEDLPVDSIHSPSSLAQAVVQRGCGSLEVRVFETK